MMDFEKLGTFRIFKLELQINQIDSVVKLSRYYCCNNDRILVIDLDKNDEKEAVFSQPRIENCVFVEGLDDLFVFSIKNIIYLINYKTKAIKKINEFENSIKTLAISNTNDLLSIDIEKKCTFWSLPKCEQIISEESKKLTDHFQENYSTCLSPSKFESILFYQRTDGDIGCVGVGLYKKFQTFKMSQKDKLNCIVPLSEYQIVAGGEEKTLYHFGLNPFRSQNHTAPILKIISYINYGEYVVVSASNNELIIWDISNKTISKLIDMNKEIRFYLLESGYFLTNYGNNRFKINDFERKEIGTIELCDDSFQYLFDNINIIGNFDAERNQFNFWEFNKFESFKDTIDVDQISNAEIFSLSIQNSQLVAFIGDSLFKFDINSGELLVNETKKISMKNQSCLSLSNDLSEIIIWNHGNIYFGNSQIDTYYKLNSMNFDQEVTSFCFGNNGSPLFGTKSSSIHSLPLDFGRKIFEIGKDLHGKTPILSIASSMNGETLVSGGEDKIIKIWQNNFPELKLLGELSGHSEGVHLLKFNETNEDLVLSGGLDHKIGVWNIKEKKLVKKFFVGHSDRITDLIFSPDSQQIISSSKDKTLIFWDFNSNEKELISFQDKYMKFLAITTDSMNLFCADSQGKISKWDAKSQRNIPFVLQKNIPLSSSIEYDCKECWVTSDNKYMIILNSDNSLLVWDWNTMKQCFVIDYFEITACCLSSNDKSFLFSTKNPTMINQLNFSNGEIIQRFSKAVEGSDIYRLQTSPDDSVIASNHGNLLKFWRENKKTTEFQIDINKIVGPFFVNNDKVLIGSTSREETFKILNLESGIEIKLPINAIDGLASMIYNEKKKILLTAYKYKTNLIEIWDLNRQNFDLLQKKAILYEDSSTQILQLA